MTLSLIAAVAENGAIGKGNALPWRLPSDLKRFRERTMGHPVIMGRVTHETIGRALEGRTNIVLTEEGYAPAEGAVRAGSLEEALRLAERAEGGEEAFVIGGASVYTQAMPLADRLYLTRVHANVPGDVFFPQIDLTAWREMSCERGMRSVEDEYDFSFSTYERNHRA